jgi:hypothetical protein
MQIQPVSGYSEGMERRQHSQFLVTPSASREFS